MKTLVIKTVKNNELIKVYTGTAGVLCFYRDNHGKFLRTSGQREFNWLAGQVKRIETRNENFEILDWSSRVDYSECMNNQDPGVVYHLGEKLEVHCVTPEFVVEGRIICLYSNWEDEIASLEWDKKERCREMQCSGDILVSNLDKYLTLKNWPLMEEMEEKE